MTAATSPAFFEQPPLDDPKVYQRYWNWEDPSLPAMEVFPFLLGAPPIEAAMLMAGVGNELLNPQTLHGAAGKLLGQAKAILLSQVTTPASAALPAVGRVLLLSSAVTQGQMFAAARAVQASNPQALVQALSLWLGTGQEKPLGVHQANALMKAIALGLEKPAGGVILSLATRMTGVADERTFASVLVGARQLLAALGNIYPRGQGMLGATSRLAGTGVVLLAATSVSGAPPPHALTPTFAVVDLGRGLVVVLDSGARTAQPASSGRSKVVVQ